MKMTKIIRLVLLVVVLLVAVVSGARHGDEAAVNTVDGEGDVVGAGQGVVQSDKVAGEDEEAGGDEEEVAAGVSDGVETDEVEEKSESEGDDSGDEDYVAPGAASRKRRRSGGVKGQRGGSPQAEQGRKVRPRYFQQKRSEWESTDSEEGADKESGEEEDGEEEDEGVVAKAKGWVFPAELVPKKIGRARVVKMGLPEVLLPKGQARSATQEYALICNSVGDARKTADGKRMNGAWARFVEVCAGTDSEMLKLVHRETRMWELEYRRDLALAKQEGLRQRMKASFIKRMTGKLGLARVIAEEMWGVAERELKTKHGDQIREDVEELAELMRRAEEWRVDPPTDTCGGGTGPRSPSDRGGGPSGGVGGGGSGVGLGLAVGALASVVGRQRSR